MKKPRISVALPQDMMAHYKEIAKVSGISVSRLIYLRLKSKKPIMIVSRDVLEAVNELKKLVVDISRIFLQMKNLASDNSAYRNFNCTG